MDSAIKTLLKETFREVILEYSLNEKVKIIKLIKTLVNSNVDKNKLKSILDFYKYYPGEPYQIVDKTTFEEFENTLIKLADEEGINIPDELRM